MYKITPEYLTASVNFFYNHPDWHYTREGPFSIPKIQAEGSAKLWNMLLDKRIALLADEVGMGKTIQALAVMSTLWQQKPDAKVLLYAPNENVALKWIREYENFIRYHYRLNDDAVKSSINGMPLREAIYCENHLELLQKSYQKWPSFYVCKTSSLSGFLSPRITEEALAEVGIRTRITADEKSDEDEKLKWVYTLGRKSNELHYRLFSRDDQPPFDLLIFDEAHYLRRADGESLRSIAAHAFFAGRDIHGENAWDIHKPIASKVLLLTATPNHSAAEDIRSITGLFEPPYRKKSAIEILNELCVRRFRRLEGKTKHEYREEIAEGVEMQQLRERLFFAAYHKGLVRSKAEAVAGQPKSRMDNPYRVLFGYLEGFEFLPHTTESKKINQTEGQDFHHRDDSEVIVKLSNLYKRTYKSRPEHPKYQKITEVLQPREADHFSPEKKLVFVRRIASVYEISSRVIEHYDFAYQQFLQPVFSKKENRQIEQNPRRFFFLLSKGDNELLDEDEESQKKADKQTADSIGEIESRFLSLFTIRKEGKYRTTDCSNFRLRFQKRDQIFSVFFDPPADYRKGRYSFSSMLINAKNKRLYKNTAQEQRMDKLDPGDSNRLILEQQFGLTENYDHIRLSTLELETLLTIWLTYEVSRHLRGGEIDKARKEYHQFTIFEKEGFSLYLEKGILFGSQHVIRFYALYRDIIRRKEVKGEDLYTAFCIRVRETMDSSGLSGLMAKAVLTFRIYYKKELGLTEDTLMQANWNFLTNTLPAYPYCSDNRRETIIKAFNSPFYPDVLIATSVLQEGVDLHYHCSEIIHYGIAWTQGDNEQRVGRVDRMFGKLENRLKEKDNATLPVHYPFLRNTIDQDQVARFIIRKHHSEKLLDQLKNVSFSNEINFRERVPEDVWNQYLNVPGKNQIEHDPFPVLYNRDFGQVTAPPLSRHKSLDVHEYLSPLWNSLHRHFKDEFVLFKKETLSPGDQKVFAIRHIRPNQRHQPIIGEIGYSEQGLYFLKKPVYHIRLSTPMARSWRNMEGINKFGLMQKTYNDNPLLKICLDKQVKGFFRFYVAADLPLFTTPEGLYNLSQDEIIQVIESLIHFSDSLEVLIHGSILDIKNEDVIEGEQASWQGTSDATLSGDRVTMAGRGWNQTKSGKYIYKVKELLTEDYEEIYKFNHANYFLRKLYEAGRTWLQTGVYKNDSLPEECLLMEKILDAVIA